MILALFQRALFLFALLAAPTLLTYASLHDRSTEDAASPTASHHAISPRLKNDSMTIGTQARKTPMDLAQETLFHCGFQMPHDQGRLCKAAHFLQESGHSDTIIENLMAMATQYAHEIKPNGKIANAHQTARFLSKSEEILREHQPLSTDIIDFAFRALSRNAPHASIEAQGYYLDAFSWVFMNTQCNDTAHHICKFSYQLMRPDHTTAECDAIISYIHQFVIDANTLRPAALTDAVTHAQKYESWEILPFLEGFVKPYAQEKRPYTPSVSGSFSPVQTPDFSPLTSEEK